MSSGSKILFQRNLERGILSFEVVTLAYILVTSVMIAVEWGSLPSPMSMLLFRIEVLAIMALMYLIYRLYPCRLTILLRIAPLFLALIWWYPETYTFCSQFDYQDHIFAEIDYRIFGFQPALVFDQVLSSTFWYEFFNMGYYSYYYLMVATVMYYFLAKYDDMQRATFVFFASFFLFYLVFDFLPVAGPQYYYCANGTDLASQAVFPQMHDYFRLHREILPLEVRGFFSKMVLAAQETGENPTAAFPSSHVGMTIVTMLLAWQSGSKRLFWILFPFAIILFFSTVYVKAHYAIDSVAGLVVGALFFAITNQLYKVVRKPWHLKP